MRELRSSLSEIRLNDSPSAPMAEQAIFSAFRSRTGRNQPSNTRFIFGPSVWLRGLVQPPPNHGLAYIDWSQQEFGIAAALSGDQAMMRAYLSGDPYLAFAKLARASPDATKQTHGPTRELFKACVLAVHTDGADWPRQPYRRSTGRCARLQRAYRETFRHWRWADAAVDHALIHGSLHTVFGWRLHVTGDPNPRCLRISHAGKRRRNAAPRLLPSYRARHQSIVLSCPRRRADLRADRSAG